jgi:hypothetical protein
MIKNNIQIKRKYLFRAKKMEIFLIYFSDNKNYKEFLKKLKIKIYFGLFYSHFIKI